VPETILGHQAPPAESALSAEAVTLPPASLPTQTDAEASEFVSGIMEAGTVLGVYRLVKLLGKGGMGEVYLAVHTKLGRKVALKLLRSKYAADTSAVRRFFREARAASQINHPNIVAINDFIENEAGNCFYVMEYLEGETLADRIKRGGVVLEEILEIGQQIGTGLEALHGAGVIHRDLKPANIFLVRQEGQPVQVKLLDFGLIKLGEAADVDRVAAPTNPDMLVGTPEYMAPEHIRNISNLDHRADLYSLGVILYEMVSSRRPIEASSMGELLVSIVTEPPRRLDPGVTAPPLKRLIMQCLEKGPQDRPASAAEVVSVLQSLRKQAGARRRRAWPWVVGLLGVLVAMAALALGLNSRTATVPAPTDKPIAVLKALRRDVRHRARDSARWGDAKQRMDLRHLDALKTGAGSRAEVTFHVGGQLEVQERSVVLIEAPDPEAPEKGPVTRIKSGGAKGIAEPGRPLVFYTPDGRVGRLAATGAKRATFRLVTRDNGTTEVAVLKGAATLRSADKSVELSAGQVVDVVKGGKLGEVARLLRYPSLESPVVDEELEGKSVVLRWSAIPRATRYRVQVSRDLMFDARVVDRRVVGTVLTIPDLSPGKYVWRASSIDAKGREGEFGFARRFSIKPPAGAAPSIDATPGDNAVVKVAEPPAEVAFRWTGLRPPVVLVVARSQSLDRFVTKRVSLEVNTATVSLKPGVYYWGLFRGRGKRRTPLIRTRRLLVRKKLPPELHLPEIDWKKE
jgi:tRNA A-37 threonylcarbamoyl transferase component Bud32